MRNDGADCCGCLSVGGGVPYSPSLSPSIFWLDQVLDQFAAFGFVVRHTRADGGKASRFYPSTVATHLVRGAHAAALAGASAASASSLSSLSPPSSVAATSLGGGGGGGVNGGDGGDGSGRGGGGGRHRIANLSHFEAIVQTNFQVTRSLCSPQALLEAVCLPCAGLAKLPRVSQLERLSRAFKGNL